MSISEISTMSTSETFVAIASEFSAIPSMELSILCFGMLAGYLITRQASKRNGTPCSSLRRTEQRPIKQTTIGNRIGFQAEPPAEQEASILLQQGKVKAAVALLKKLPETMAGSVPTSAARSILLTAMRASAPKLGSMMSDLKPLVGKIGPGALDALVAEAAAKKDADACRQLHALSQSLDIPRSEAVFEAFAHACASDANSLRGLVAEADVPLAPAFAEIILEACAAFKNADLKAEVLAKMSSSDAAHLQRGASTNTDLPVQMKQINHSPSSTTVGSEPSSSATSSPRSSSTEDEAGSCHARMEGYLAAGQEAAAKAVLEELIAKDLATAGCYHGLVNARVSAGDVRGAWKLVTDMQVNGICPDAATCTILFKGKPQTMEEVSRILCLVDAMDEPMDDVLFMSLADACILVGRLDMLSKQLQKYSGSLTTETYGAIIQAYGKSHDVKRVWDTWKQMVSQQMLLTSLVVSSMVEALVTNGLCADAWKLVQDLEDKGVQALMNTTIYSTMLKGFANALQIEKMMRFYAEMKVRQVQLNTTSFNAMFKAFGQAGTLQHMPTVLADMKAGSAQPDNVTYLTIIKGYCSNDCLDRALIVFKDMQLHGTCLPDEAIYTVLVRGCLRFGSIGKATELVRSAHGTGMPGLNARCVDEVVAALGGADSEKGAALLSELRL
jgi:pentatricopeptide repeat protein